MYLVAFAPELKRLFLYSGSTEQNRSCSAIVHAWSFPNNNEPFGSFLSQCSKDEIQGPSPVPLLDSETVNGAWYLQVLDLSCSVKDLDVSTNQLKNVRNPGILWRVKQATRLIRR